MEDVQANRVDETTPGARWEFDVSVTDAFNDMLRRSIPQYNVMRQAVLDLGNAFISIGKIYKASGVSLSDGEDGGSFVNLIAEVADKQAAEKTKP